MSETIVVDKTKKRWQDCLVVSGDEEPKFIKCRLSEHNNILVLDIKKLPSKSTNKVKKTKLKQPRRVFIDDEFKRRLQMVINTKKTTRTKLAQAADCSYLTIYKIMSENSTQRYLSVRFREKLEKYLDFLGA